MHSIWYKMLKIALAKDPDGGTNDAPPCPLVVRSFLPSAISPLCTINASIVQGSGLGPSNFVITVSLNMPTIDILAGPCFLPADLSSFDRHCSRAYILLSCHVQFIHIILKVIFFHRSRWFRYFYIEIFGEKFEVN